MRASDPLPTPIYIHTLAEELLRFVNVTHTAPPTTAIRRPQQGRDWIPDVELYVLSPPGNENQLEEFFDQWTQFDVAPAERFWRVFGLQYSPPLELVGQSKSHLAALGHFILHSNRSRALVVPDSFSFADREAGAMLEEAMLLQSEWDLVLLAPRTPSFYSTEHWPLAPLNAAGSSPVDRALLHLTGGYMCSRDYLDRSALYLLFEKTTIYESVVLRHSSEIISNMLLTDGRLSHQHRWFSFSSKVAIGGATAATTDPLQPAAENGVEPLNSVAASEVVPWNKTIFLIGLGTYLDNMDVDYITLTLLQMNPGYTVRVIDDLEAERLIAQHFALLLPVFHRLPLFQWKSDMVRLVLLYLYGGVYMDFGNTDVYHFFTFLTSHFVTLLDIKLVLGFDDMLRTIGHSVERVFVRSANVATELCNGVIIAKRARDPMFAALLQQMLRNDYDGLANDMRNQRYENMPYGVNLRNLYDSLFEQYGRIENFQYSDKTYFMREIQVNEVEQRYVIKLNPEVTATYTNGNRNWPPMRNKKQELLLST